MVQHTERAEALVATIVDAALEEMVAAFKQGESVSLRDFGTFYICPERSSSFIIFNSPAPNFLIKRIQRGLLEGSNRLRLAGVG